MIGVRKLNPSDTLFIRDGQLIVKSTGNIDQRGSQPNDWVAGHGGPDTILSWGKYLGGNKKDNASYDIDSQINTANFPDV